jgi:transcriptional regulator with XRE-family HTH domain
VIYENIKRVSTKMGKSIRSIEIEAGLGNGVIAGWKSSSPMVDNLKSVAKVLGVTIESLLDENEG